MRTALAIATVFSTGLILTQPAHADDDELGKVNFETSCNPEAQKLFNRRCCIRIGSGTAPRNALFEDALKADPECGIAYWGIAPASCGIPTSRRPRRISPTAPPRSPRERASAPRPQRERDYLDALGVMYADHDKVDHRTRIVAYAKAMEQLAQRYPDDDEAQIHYALALNTSASPADKPYAGHSKARRSLSRSPANRNILACRIPDPPLRLSGDRRERPRCGAALAENRTGGGPCPAHAVAYLYTRRLLERIDRLECGIAGRQGVPRISTTSCRPWTIRSMPICSSARTEGQGRHRRETGRHRLQETSFGTYGLAVSPALYAVERGDWSVILTCGPPQPAGSGTGDHLFRPCPWRRPLRQS